MDAPTDIVFIDTLRLPANIGPDCWNKEREQPTEITINLHLREAFLKKAGHSDDVLDSVHYGHLTKQVSTLIRSERKAFSGTDDLVSAVAHKAFELAEGAAEEVRVVLDVPKWILLAAGFSVDVTTSRGIPNRINQKKVHVKDIVLPVIIGVNPPEREAKQRVVINIIFYEAPANFHGPQPVDYRNVVAKLVEEIETTQYLTLEKFVMEIVRLACLSSEHIHAVTARAQKPSALSFAQSSGVEITRKREVFV